MSTSNPLSPALASVIAKLTCHGKSEGPTGSLSFGGVYSQDKSEREDSMFGDTTPSAHLSMAIYNPPAFAFFEQGAAYYTLFVNAKGIDYRALVAAVNAEVARQQAAAAPAVEG